MKLETPKQDVKVVGNFVTTDYAVGDIAFVVDMFADKVYTHKERAVIRELACNAYDSHVEANNQETNFDVHLPTHLEPWFSIRDYGVGLDDNQVRNIFAGIGISTKRNNNNTIGCFGIGSLSPYSLCDSFTVKSWKDGKERIYTCYRDVDRRPVVAMLSEQDSDEPNGLEVSLSIDGRITRFEEEAVTVFRWWDRIPNINNKFVEEQCKLWQSNYDLVGENYAIRTNWGNMVAIMGNVAYNIPSELDEINRQGYIRFELGEISFDTARENLSLDDKTRNAIKEKFSNIHKDVIEDAVKEIEKLDTQFKRAKAVHNLLNNTLAGIANMGSVRNAIRSALSSKFELPETTTPIKFWKKCYRSIEERITKNLPLDDSCEYYVHKDRMQVRVKNYLKENPNVTLVVLTEDQIKETSIDLDVLKNLDDLPLPAKRTYVRGTTVKTFAFNTNYTGWKNEKFYKEIEFQDDGSEKVYVEICRSKPVGSDFASSNGRIREIANSLRDFIPIPIILGLKTAFLDTKAFRTGKFIRFDDYIKRELAKVAPTKYHKYDGDMAQSLRQIVELMHNEELREFIDLYGKQAPHALVNACKQYQIEKHIPVVEDTSIQEFMDKFFKKYEMLTILSDWEIRENQEKVANYIGATLNKRK
jgi:hypothetical protein